MNRLKELRESYKETQDDIGKILNVSKGTISKYENGTVEISNEALIKIANHYNVSVDYLLCRTSTPDVINESIRIAAKTTDNLDISNVSEYDKEIIKSLLERLKNKDK